MNDEQIEVGYDQFFANEFEERIEIFNEISAYNRAFLFKTQAIRWLAKNRSQITSEQESLVEETIEAISPKWYEKNDDSEENLKEVEKYCVKLENFFSREDVVQISTIQAEHIPLTDEKHSKSE